MFDHGKVEGVGVSNLRMLNGLGQKHNVSSHNVHQLISIDVRVVKVGKQVVVAVLVLLSCLL